MKPKDQDTSIGHILGTIKSSEEVLERAFNNAPDFKIAHKQACERFINEHPAFISELLARQLNARLRRGEGSSQQHSQSEGEINTFLDKILGVFKFLQGKDMFEGFYRRAIIKRLL